MLILNFLSILSLLIASGSVALQRGKNKDAMIENSTYGPLIFAGISLFTTVFIMLNLIRIFDIDWYWCLMIAMVVKIIVGTFFAQLYSSLFGFKSKPFLNLFTGDRNYRANLHYKDFILNIIIGVITYLFSFI